LKRIAILGSTGSIGRQTLAVIKELDQHFKVVAAVMMLLPNKQDGFSLR